jgi:hypothetical protein
LSLNTLAITGANSGDFTETDTCHVPTVLQPSKSCSVLIYFSPTATGPRSAALTITDNAAPDTESVQLSGIGLTPAPAVTLAPGSLNFGTTTQGTSTTLNITVTNSGTAALHISGVTLGGANTNDFSVSDPTCTGAIPVNGSCTVAVTFVPLAPGVRSTAISLADDAPDSPQIANVEGNATPAIQVGPAPSGQTTATVSAGGTAQYQLQVTPGTGYTGSVSLACSGAPLGAVCQIPASVMVTNGTPAPFTVNITTSGSGAMLPVSDGPRNTPLGGPSPLLLLVCVCVLILLAYSPKRDAAIRARRLAWNSALAGAVLFSVFSITGCGGGAASTMPPPIITPSGTSTITITATPSAQGGKQLAPQTFSLTLTVK